MPCDYKLYPSNWKEIRKRILKRADNKCEECGVKNYSIGQRDITGKWHDEKEIHNMNSSEGDILFNEYKPIKIILTISHNEHDLNKNSDKDLKALCQYFHNRHDIKFRVENRKKNKFKKIGQMELI